MRAGVDGRRWGLCHGIRLGGVWWPAAVAGWWVAHQLTALPGPALLVRVCAAWCLRACGRRRDITRKKKLLKKQQAGKKRMQAHGRVVVPQAAYLAVLQRQD